MTCWAPERDHHYSKTIAKDCFSNCTATILDRSNYHFFSDLADNPNILEETYLKTPTPFNAEIVGMIGHSTSSWNAMTHVGELARGTYAWVVDVATLTPVLCLLKQFLRVGNDPVQVVCAPMAYLGAHKWCVEDVGRHVVAPVSHVVSRAIVHIEPSAPLVAYARP